MLVALWPELYLPEGLPQAWEDRHAALRATPTCCLMPVGRLHGQVATIALSVAASRGFALGGGNALMAHGIIDRMTQDVDVFSVGEDAVAAVAERWRRPCSRPGSSASAVSTGAGRPVHGLGGGWPSGS